MLGYLEVEHFTQLYFENPKYPPHNSLSSSSWAICACIQMIFPSIHLQVNRSSNVTHTTWIRTCNKSSSVHTFLNVHIEASLCITDHNQNLHTLIGYWVTSYIHNLQPPFHYQPTRYSQHKVPSTNIGSLWPHDSINTINLGPLFHQQPSMYSHHKVPSTNVSSHWPHDSITLSLLGSLPSDMPGDRRRLHSP